MSKIRALALTDEEKNESVDTLIEDLKAAEKTIGKGKAKKFTNKVFNSNKTIVSWKFNEWDYGKAKISLPTQARGLFTWCDPATSRQAILIRGYDKFFNIDEVPTTKWEYIKNHTRGPYELSIKENGCIIFIGGTADGEIVVCSKHSTGERDDVNKNHALEGQNALERQLTSKGLSMSDLAKALYEMNCTAVAELCDDSFEEHVLPYSKQNAGLYLHGLNCNKPIFKTYPMHEVCRVADSFGFHRVGFLVEDSVDKLHSFLSRCALTGSYNDREVEGFVIRCKLNDDRDFLFKYKFEEPYLMYRQWREFTKQAIAGKSIREIRVSKHKVQTYRYLEYAIRALRANPQMAQDYVNNKGIIALRNMYLQSCGKSGMDVVNQESETEISSDLQKRLESLTMDRSQEEVKYVFIPVATIGCGKTTAALTMCELFPSWGHIENDDIPSPVKDQLVKGALDILVSKKACFVGRNNHQVRERKQLFDDFEKLARKDTRYKFICLNFVENKYDPSLWDLTFSRVMQRGNNHQSIKADQYGPEKVEAIMRGFVGRFQPVDESRDPDAKFDYTIRMGATKDFKQNMKRALSILHETYPDLVEAVPSDIRIEEAFQKALGFKTDFVKVVKSSLKPRKPAYFSILVPSDIMKRAESLVPVCESMKEKKSPLHVTLTHIGGIKDKEVKKVWNKYLDVFQQQLPSSPQAGDICALKGVRASFQPMRLCWNDSIVCVQVAVLSVMRHGESLDLVSSNKYPHVTLAMKDGDVKAFSSNKLLSDINDFGDGGSEGTHSMDWPHSEVVEGDVIVNY